MFEFAQILIAALAVGGLYALIALGYTMVYGILKFINFAHSDIVVLGAWLSYVMAKRALPWFGDAPDTAAPWWFGAVVILLAMLACSVIGVLIERLAYKPLRRAPRLNVLITAIGVSLLLQNVGQLDTEVQGHRIAVFGANPQNMPKLVPDLDVLRVTYNRKGGADRQTKMAFFVSPDVAVEEGRNVIRLVTLVDVIILATSAVLMLLLEFLVYRTKFGAAIRAVSFNTDTAALMGIPVDRVISLTFVLGSALAAAAGFLFSMKYSSLSHPADSTWVLLGLKAFVAAVVGGIGNVRGAVLGGFTIAFVEQFGAYYISSNYTDVYVFSLLILILLVKPTGILGSPLREKV